MHHDPCPSPPPGFWSHAVRLTAATVVGAWVWVVTVGSLPPGAGGPVVVWLLLGDPLLGLVCVAVAGWRRRWPLTVAVTVTVLSTASIAAGGAVLLTLGSLATHRRTLPTAALAIAVVASALPAQALYPHRETAPEELWYQLAVVVAALVATVAAGIAIGTRREQVRTLRQRAELVEREHAARTARARIAERHRIAREMHDVLAHRVSLVAMQAGALGHRTDLPPEQAAQLARDIAAGARQALDELRDVLGVLRSTTAAGDGAEADAESGGEVTPPPALDDIATLVGSARAAGLDVSLDGPPSTSGPLADAVARTAYRLVQEGLTNAGKHAPGARVTVGVTGAAGQNLRVLVHDTGATRPTTATTSGFGLAGLAERVASVGGRLVHGRADDGGFTLCATLPWPAGTEDR